MKGVLNGGSTCSAVAQAGAEGWGWGEVVSLGENLCSSPGDLFPLLVAGWRKRSPWDWECSPAEKAVARVRHARGGAPLLGNLLPVFSSCPLEVWRMGAPGGSKGSGGVRHALLGSSLAG